MGLTVLAYHAVATYPNPLAVDQSLLRDQMRLMLRKGLRPVRFGDAVLEQPRADAFAVTFDDGFRSVVDRALPVLDELGIPATVFLPSALVGQDGPLSWPGLTSEPMPASELAPMTWEQVRTLVDAGWEVGSHSAHHLRLTGLDDRQLTEELEESLRTCEEQSGARCRTLAYPFGAADARVVDAAERTGYAAAVTMSRLRLVGPLAVPRTGVYAHDTRRRFGVKVSRPFRTPVAATALSVLHGAR